MRAEHQIGGDQLPDDAGRDRHGVEVDLGQAAAAAVALRRGPPRTRQLANGVADQDQRAALDESGAGRHPFERFDQTEEPDDRGRVDVGPTALVVEADVATDAGDPEGDQGLRQAVDRLRQLPHDLGVLGVAEVHAVDHGHRARPDHRQVHHRLADRHRRSEPGVHRTPQVVAVGGHRHPATGVDAGRRVLEAKDGGVAARCDHGVEEQHVVVLGPHPRRVAEHVEQVGSRVRRRGQAVGRVLPSNGQVRRLGPGTVVQRRLVLERPGRHIGHHLGTTAVSGGDDAEATAVGHGADHRGLHLPSTGDGQDVVELVGFDDGEHPLLGLRGHHLERRHVRLATGHGVDVDVHAGAALGGGLGGGAGDAGTAEVLHADRQVAVEELQARLDQALLLERIADLHAGTLVGVGLVVAEAGAGQDRHSADAVTTGAGSEQDRQVADALGAAEDQPLGRHQTEAEDVDQRVALVGLVEHRLAADVGDADGVAVAGHPRHDALGDPA